MIIDAFGKKCPQPLMMAKKEIDAGSREFGIQVDDQVAVKNLTRLAGKMKLEVSSKEVEGGFLVSFSDSSAPAEAITDEEVIEICATSSYEETTAFFIGKDFVGDGDKELGKNLMNMALYTLTEMAELPDTIVFMNSGVKLVADPESQSYEHAKKLEEFGVEVLVCGTCLNFYELGSDIGVGEVSNMYDILDRLTDVSKVITL